MKDLLQTWLIPMPSPGTITWSESDILHLPIPKTNGNIDKILWKHSFSGNYHVKTTYSLIHKSHTTSQHLNHRTSIIPGNTWYQIWKVKLPMKILSPRNFFMIAYDNDKIVNMNTHWWKGIERRSKQNRRTFLCPLTSDDNMGSTALNWWG